MKMLALLFLIACDGDVGVVDIQTSDDTAAPEESLTGEDGGIEDGEGGEGGEGDMPEPTTCEVDDDCLGEDACPPDSVDCICYDQICSPACETDDDCPVSPEGDAVACDVDAGVCEPPQGGPPQ